MTAAWHMVTVQRDALALVTFETKGSKQGAWTFGVKCGSESFERNFAEMKPEDHCIPDLMNTDISL